jgi:hypothetical protein
MFERKLSEQEILRNLEKRKSEIKKIDKLPKLDEFYLSFLVKYEGVEIIPDIIIFGYEKVLTENRYIKTNYPHISQFLWIIGETGQGDGWFINVENGRILFYDHNQGEYINIEQFICFNISFLEFLQMAFLYQELENSMDEKTINKGNIDDFKNAINSIQPNLYELYPFKYF